MSQLYFNQTINRIAYVIIRHTYRELLELCSSCSLPIEYRQNNSSLRTSSLRSSRHRAWTHSCLLAIRSLGGSLIGIQDVEGFTPFLSCSNHRETHVFFQLTKRFIPVQKIVGNHKIFRLFIHSRSRSFKGSLVVRPSTLRTYVHRLFERTTRGAYAYCFC